MGSSAYKNVRFLVLASDGLWDVISTAEVSLEGDKKRAVGIPVNGVKWWAPKKVG